MDSPVPLLEKAVHFISICIPPPQNSHSSSEVRNHLRRKVFPLAGCSLTKGVALLTFIICNTRM